MNQVQLLTQVVIDISTTVGDFNPLNVSVSNQATLKQSVLKLYNQLTVGGIKPEITSEIIDSTINLLGELNEFIGDVNRLYSRSSQGNDSAY